MKQKRSLKKILIATSEAVPFVKTGGLGDVCGALAKILKQLHHDVRLVLPRYYCINPEEHNLERKVFPMGVCMGNCQLWSGVWEGRLQDVPVYFIEHEGFFGRDGIYDDGYNEYHDNAYRFGFFSRAVMQMCIDLEWQPDIIHCNDWQTALLPAYLKIWGSDRYFFEKTASIFSIHNIGYQGKFPSDAYGFLGLGEHHFTADLFECHGRIHFMKGGLFFADAISTVSPTHAEELMTGIGSNGLAPYIERRREDVRGILNGADYEVWDPEWDPLLPENFCYTELKGKWLCKETLQRIFNLNVRPDVPVVAVISRLTHQKGLDLLIPTIEHMVENMRVQFMFHGRGEKRLEDYFGSLPARYPGRIGAWIGYQEVKAHLILAGADFLLMPSLYEPCGLTQIYAMEYGTLPIVRSTGGLADTVENYDEIQGTGTGFKFESPSHHSVYHTVGWAISTYYDRQDHFFSMRARAMRKRFTWVDSALEYEKLYEHAHSRRKAWV